MKVYVGTYGKYNSGSIAGAWLDIEDYDDKDEFYEACAELHKDEDDPEFMFQDHEDIPGGMISESHIDDMVFELAKLDDHEQMVVKLYLDAVDQNGTIEQALEAFMGTADSEGDYMEQFHEDMGDLKKVPDFIRYHIDWDGVARDSQLNFVRTDNGDVYVYNT